MSQTSEKLTYDVFCAWVRDALNRLYDAAFLQNSPLIEHLVPLAERSAYPGKDLRKRLIAAIHAKEPPRNAPPQSKDRRGYQILEQRFITGLSPNEVAERLNISRSLFFLEQARMLDSLASNLWEQRIEPQPIEVDSENLLPPQASQEALRLLENTTLTVVPLAKLLQSLSPLVTSMGVTYGVKVDVSATGEREVIRGSWVLLRQIILSLAGEWMPVVQGGTFSLQVIENETAFGIQLLATAPETLPPQNSISHSTGLHPETCRQLVSIMEGSFTSAQATSRTWEIKLQWPLENRSHVLLLVDDNRDIPDLIRRYLVGTAWSVIAVEDTSAARQAIRDHHPDAILLDVLLPVEDGWEFLMSLKADVETQTIPIIVCSAVGEKRLATALGAVDFLPKPLSESVLLRALAALP